MKNIITLFMITIILILTGCSNIFEADNASTGSINSTTNESSKIVVQNFYTLIGQNRISDIEDTESADSLCNGTYQSFSELFSIYTGLYEYFKNPDYKITSIESWQIEQPQNLKNQSSYIFDAFKIEYLIDFEDDKGFYFNDGINTDYVYLLKEKDKSSSDWKIWKIVNERNQTASEACVELYKEPGSNQNFSLYLEKTSPYYEKNIEHYKSIKGTIDYDSIYVSPFPHPFETDASTYEVISMVVAYDISTKTPEILSPESRHYTDYVHMIRDTDNNEDGWRVWKVEQRINKEAEKQLIDFFDTINKQDYNSAFSLTSTHAEKNDIEYMYNWISNIKTAKINEIQVWEGPPGGDHYIDGYTFYRFRVDGAFIFKEKDLIGSDSETVKYVSMIKKNNENNWYIYAISNSP